MCKKKHQTDRKQHKDYGTYLRLRWRRHGGRMRVERVRRHHDGGGLLHFVVVVRSGRCVGGLGGRFGRLVAVLAEVRAERQRFGGPDDLQHLAVRK